LHSRLYSPGIGASVSLPKVVTLRRQQPAAVANQALLNAAASASYSPAATATPAPALALAPAATAPSSAPGFWQNASTGEKIAIGVAGVGAVALVALALSKKSRRR
jgi:hypothetical protein